MIPVFDLNRQIKGLEGELQEAISDVLCRGTFILGPKVAEFEKAFADYIGVKYAVGVASGTDAITLGLRAIGVKGGDEVIMPANCYPSVFGVVASGALPRLVDIDPLTYNIDPAKIEKAISKKTKAILPVHLYGQAADMEQIMAIGRKYKIPVVEDCAQAVGATVKSHVARDKNLLVNELAATAQTSTHFANFHHIAPFYKKVGSIGDIGCFSFYPTKNLGAFGDGGMVVTNDATIYKKLKLLRMYGEETRYNSVIVGKNSRLDELQAAILLIKLKYLDNWIKRRREIASLYRGSCRSRVPNRVANRSTLTATFRFGNPSLASPAIELPFEASFARHTYHLFVIRSKNRDQLKTYLTEHGVGTGIHYPSPIHLQPSFAYLGYKKGDFKESEKTSQEVLSIPMWPELKDNEVEKVVHSIDSFMNREIPGI